MQTPLSKFIAFAIVAITASMLISCQNQVVPEPAETNRVSNNKPFKIPYQKFTLDNGLEVILHQDSSNPIVAVATLVHVGSNREKPGRTGFAHFFEHMAFNNSENTPVGASRELVELWGGRRNGGTNRDSTVYYEVVPKDAFDKILWMDSDRLGFMIKTVSDDALEREKQVVKNEKRQRVDNRAYGHRSYIINKALYPEGHPYNWSVIGELEDLQNATLQDVREFYHQYYSPSNATLVIAGDIDFEETKKKVDNWFGEIPKGREVDSLKPAPVKLKESKQLYHLDNFAKAAQLTMVWPTVERYHPDSYALSALGSVLSSGRESIFFKNIVEDKKYSSRVSAGNSSSELAGSFRVSVTARKNVDLDKPYSEILRSLRQFESEGFDDFQLERIKTSLELGLYKSLESVLRKAFTLATYNMYAGSPDYLSEHVDRFRSVTRDDINRVYEKYIKNKPFITVSMVPKSMPQLAVEGSDMAQVKEEEIIQGVEGELPKPQEPQFSKTPTSFDRSEPPFGPPVKIKTPKIENGTLKNGIPIKLVENRDLPLVEFSIRFEGGSLLERASELGYASFMASLMNNGTENLSPKALDRELNSMGSRINFNASWDAINIRGTTLTRNLERTVALAIEMLEKPRWDENEFERIKRSRVSSVNRLRARPNSIASQILLQNLHLPKDRRSKHKTGGLAAIKSTEVSDLKEFYTQAIGENNVSIQVVGDLDIALAKNVFSPLSGVALGQARNLEKHPRAREVLSPKVYFYDMPKAKQSFILAATVTVPYLNPEYSLIDFATNRLGRGSSSRLFQSLRIEKGYTYGASGSQTVCRGECKYMISTSVRTNVTKESLELLKYILADYRETLSQEDIQVTKDKLIKGHALANETNSGVLWSLARAARFDLPDDFIESYFNRLDDFSLLQAKSVLAKHLPPSRFVFVVVGDAQTQLERVEALSLPVELVSGPLFE